MNEVLNLFTTTMKEVYANPEFKTENERKEYVVNKVTLEYPVFNQRICLRTFLPSLFDLIVGLEKGQYVVSNVLSRYITLINDDGDPFGERSESNDYEFTDEDDDDSEYIQFRG